jgi:hypothetical protein
MRLPVPNLSSAIVDKLGKVIPPWNSWFQQFSQNAPDAVTVSGSSFTANTPGNLIIRTGAPTITLIRGSVNIIMTGQKVIPISIGDTVDLAGAYTASFLGD